MFRATLSSDQIELRAKSAHAAPTVSTRQPKETASRKNNPADESPSMCPASKAAKISSFAANARRERCRTQFLRGDRGDLDLTIRAPIDLHRIRHGATQ